MSIFQSVSEYSTEDTLRWVTSLKFLLPLLQILSLGNKTLILCYFPPFNQDYGMYYCPVTSSRGVQKSYVTSTFMNQVVSYVYGSRTKTPEREVNESNFYLRLVDSYGPEYKGYVYFLGLHVESLIYIKN